MIAEYYANTESQDTDEIHGVVHCRNREGYLHSIKSAMPQDIRTDLVFGGNTVTVCNIAGSFFDKEFLAPVILFNGQRIGDIFQTKEHIQDGSMCKIFINGMSDISAYDIVVEKRFIFFCSDGKTIGCCYFRDKSGFTVFANNEWIMQILIAATVYMTKDRAQAIADMTFDSRYINFYDSNFFAEIIAQEHPSVGEKYAFLVRSEEDNKREVQNLKKKQSKSLLRGIIGTSIFFLAAIAAIVLFGISSAKEMKENSLHIINSKNGYFTVEKKGFEREYSIDIQYKDDNGETQTRSILISKSDYQKYKDEEEFDFAYRYWYDSENKKEKCEYYFGDIDVLQYAVSETDGLWMVVIFGLLIETLLIMAFVKSKKEIKDLNK